MDIIIPICFTGLFACILALEWEQVKDEAAAETEFLRDFWDTLE
jgi:hypothetical protein